ncbi:hypothetical protein C2W62_54005, partial [Candidatus Entotheonella serta]
TTDKFRTLRHINPALMFAKMIKMITRTRPERGAAIIPAHHLILKIEKRPLVSIVSSNHASLDQSHREPQQSSNHLKADACR